MSWFGAISKGANWLGRKVGQGAQFLGNKLSAGAHFLGNKISSIPIVGSAIGGALNTVGDIGNSVVDAGKALVGGHGGLAGAGKAIEQGVAKAESLANPMKFI